MAFRYYKRLSPEQKRLYRMSDEVVVVRLPHPEILRPLVLAVEQALLIDNRRLVEDVCTRFVRVFTEDVGIRPVTVSVLSKRPRSSSSELHGLYTREEGKTPNIKVWMRTAANLRVVAFRTFMRTLLHEVCHHLDFELYRWPDSFHTQGFYARENNLTKQLLGVSPKREPKAKREPRTKPEPKVAVAPKAPKLPREPKKRSPAVTKKPKPVMQETAQKSASAQLNLFG